MQTCMYACLLNCLSICLFIFPHIGLLGFMDTLSYCGWHCTQHSYFHWHYLEWRGDSDAATSRGLSKLQASNCPS